MINFIKNLWKSLWLTEPSKLPSTPVNMKKITHRKKKAKK